MSDNYANDEANLDSYESTRPDPPSSWEVYQEQLDSELEFLDSSNHDSEEPPFDVEHSLPAAEEVYIDRKRRRGYKLGAWKSYSTRFYVIVTISIVAMITIISLATGSARSKGNEASLEPGSDFVGGELFGDEPYEEDPAVRDTDLLNLLFGVYRKAGLDTSVLTSSGTPQFQALQWIADVDTRRVEIGPSLVQRYALAVMYFALGGREWSLKETRWMTNTHECE